MSLMYSRRAEHYLRQRGIPYDPFRLSIHRLTPKQRRRALHKESHQLRQMGWTHDRTV